MAYSLVSSWLFPSHSCLCWAQGPIPGLIHQMGPYQCQAELKTISCWTGLCAFSDVQPFMATRSDRGLVIDYLSVPCVLTASHQLRKFSSGRGRTVYPQPFIWMVNFCIVCPLDQDLHLFLHPSLNSLKHTFLRFFVRKQLKLHKKIKPWHLLLHPHSQGLLLRYRRFSSWFKTVCFNI